MADPNRRRAVRHLHRRARILSGLPRRLMARTQFPLRSAPTPRGVRPLPSPVGSNYDTDWARRAPARLVRRASVETAGRAVVDYFADPLVLGTDRLAELEGPAIFASNHHSHADTMVLITSIPEPWRNELVIGAAADYFFGNRLSSALSALFIGAIPIERTRLSRRSTQKAIELLRRGWSMVIFPEGGRSSDGWTSGFKPGVGFLARQASVPVVPVYIEGTGNILHKGRNWPRRGSTTVIFGEPMWFPPEGNRREFTAELERAVEVLADEVASDWWTARRRAHRGETPSLRGPNASAWRRTWLRGAPGSRSKGSSRRSWPYV